MFVAGWRHAFRSEWPFISHEGGGLGNKMMSHEGGGLGNKMMSREGGGLDNKMMSHEVLA